MLRTLKSGVMNFLLPDRNRFWGNRFSLFEIWHERLGNKGFYTEKKMRLAPSSAWRKSFSCIRYCEKNKEFSLSVKKIQIPILITLARKSEKAIFSQDRIIRSLIDCIGLPEGRNKLWLVIHFLDIHLTSELE